MSNLRIDTNINNDQQRKLEMLLAQQAEIHAQIASLLPSNAPATSSFPHHRSPIHKQQHQQRRSHNNVPRSMSSTGTSMARHLSSDRIEAPTRTRTLSQHSSHSMARTSSRGSNSARGTGLVPFSQSSTMPPPFVTESRRENPVEAWASQDQPFNSYTFSHQSPHMQRSMSQRKPELEQVPELDSLPGDNPAEFFLRTGMTGTPILQLPPSPMTMQATQLRHRLSTSSRQSYNVPTPTTPTSDSLTTATTLTTSMSRQNSLFNEPLLESIQMMKFNSNTSFSTDINPVTDPTLYDQNTPHSSRHSRRSSNEEQSQLLVGAGGASHDSQFSHSFSAVEAAVQFHSSGSFGEKMEKSQSNESTSSSSSNTSSRSKQRLQAQIAAVRPLMPKGGGGDDNVMSRDNSSQSMSRQSSKDGLQDKIAISKPTYQRPKHDRVHCNQCDDHPDGFRGEHELRRHQDRQHKLMVKKWVCVEPQKSGFDFVQPVVPLKKCKACNAQKKTYGAYYNAAAHLRRAHFKPKATKGRAKTSKAQDIQKRGGTAGGDWPSMADLKCWMMEVEEPATNFSLSAAQQQEADDDDDESFDFDDALISAPTMDSTSSSSFDTPYALSDASFGIYSSPNNNELASMQSTRLDVSFSHQQSFDSMNYTPSQSSFDNFPVASSFLNDPLAFMEHSSSLPPHLPLQNNFDEQLLGVVDPVHFSYL